MTECACGGKKCKMQGKEDFFFVVAVFLNKGGQDKLPLAPIHDKFMSVTFEHQYTMNSFP